MNNLSIEELKDARIMYKVRRDLVAITIIDELIAILELKGDQVPIAYRVFGNYGGAVFLYDEDHDYMIDDAIKQGVKTVPLYDRPQKPVVPMAVDEGIIRDANRYRFLRDEDAWGEDSDSWDLETRTGLISSENLMGGLSPDHFDAAIDARMSASDIPFLNPVLAPEESILHLDTKRMDWLCAHVVQVRQPLPYGSHEMFWSQCDSDDCEEYHTTLREQIDKHANTGENCPDFKEKEDTRLVNYLQQCSETVKLWPKWKQEGADVSKFTRVD